MLSKTILTTLLATIFAATVLAGSVLPSKSSIAARTTTGKTTHTTSIASKAASFISIITSSKISSTISVLSTGSSFVTSTKSSKSSSINSITSSKSSFLISTSSSKIPPISSITSSKSSLFISPTPSKSSAISSLTSSKSSSISSKFSSKSSSISSITSSKSSFLISTASSKPSFINNVASSKLYFGKSTTSCINVFSASSTPTQTAFANSTASGKRGLPFNNPSTYLQNWNGPGSQISWAYNWDSAMDATFPAYLEYVPMLWGNASVHTSGWAANVAIAQKTGSKHLLAFNEPDMCYAGQACMDPASAAAAYKQYMMPYASTFSLGAPVVTNGPTGLPWLQEFIALCTGCQIDFVPIHWYDSATNEPYFYNYMPSMYAAGGNRPLWITEFAGAGTTDQQITFLETVIPWLDAQTYIERYAWDWCTVGNLVLANGLPSPLGQVFGYTA